MKHYVRFFHFATCMAALAGCGSQPVVKSLVNRETGPTDKIIATYYLPQRTVRVVAKFNENGQFMRKGTDNTVISEITELTSPGTPVAVVQTGSNDYAETILVETERGLLTKIDTNANDQRQAAVEAFIEELGKLGDAGAVEAGDGPPGAPADDATFRKNIGIDYVFDPTAPANSAHGIEEFNREHAKYLLKLCVQEVSGVSADVGVRLGNQEFNGVLVPIVSEKLVRLVDLSVEGGGRASTEDSCSYAGSLLSLRTLVPSRTRAQRLDVDRTAWVQHKTTMTFADGILSSARVEKGSVTASAIRFPVTVLRALVSIPASLIRLRINYDNAAAAQATARANLLKELQAQYAEEKKLAQQRADTTGSDDTSNNASAAGQGSGDDGADAPVAPEEDGP